MMSDNIGPDPKERPSHEPAINPHSGLGWSKRGVCTVHIRIHNIYSQLTLIDSEKRRLSRF